MAYRGRYQAGQFIPLLVWTRDTNGTPTVPDNVPRAVIFDPTGARVTFLDMPACDPSGATGLFLLPVRLTSSFSTTGMYRVEYRYALSGASYVVEDGFELMPGGSASGSVISLYHWDRPQAQYLVYYTDAGTITLGRNPSF